MPYPRVPSQPCPTPDLGVQIQARARERPLLPDLLTLPRLGITSFREPGGYVSMRFQMGKTRIDVRLYMYEVWIYVTPPRRGCTRFFTSSHSAWLYLRSETDKASMNIPVEVKAYLEWRH